MSRLRENPDKLFEVFLEVGKPAAEDEEPFILQKYPLDYNDQEVLKSVPKFAFPCDTERYTTTVDHFTFTLTDVESFFKFGFCRHATGAQTCFCIVSFLPWFEVFYSFLNILAEITNRSDFNDVTVMLRAAYVQEVPSPGVPVTVVAQQEMFSFTSPDSSRLPSIPASRNLTEYYNAIDVGNMMIIFASMLHERRIIVTSKKLSRLTAVVHAASSLLYPMYWQHLFIPVLPAFLIDYLTAPMPFVIGVHTKLMERVKESELGDVVLVDADKNFVSTEYDDLEDLPDEISSHLKRHMKGEKVKSSMQGTGDVISKTFMMSLVKLIGGYRDALMFKEGEAITFNPEAFVQSRPISMQPFLQNILHLQIFQQANINAAIPAEYTPSTDLSIDLSTGQVYYRFCEKKYGPVHKILVFIASMKAQFINDRLVMLNSGRGFTDIFEQECLLHADKLNAQSRYKEWLHNMKKQGKKLQRGGKDVWSDFKDKAAPAVKDAFSAMEDLKKDAFSAMGVMKHRAGPAVSNAMESVRNQGKKAYSGIRTKIGDIKKEESPLKGSKSARVGSNTKHFSKASPGILKDRPSTIVGAPLTTRRPPRPPNSPTDSGPAVMRPKVLVRQPSSDNRLTRYVTSPDELRLSADDSDILLYNRVSCNLVNDPDIQSAIFKSASAENLPKADPLLQSSDSSGTISSDSSLDTEHHELPFIDEHDETKKSSFISYQSLFNDDDSGIVLTASQTSIDKTLELSSSKSSGSTVAGIPPPLAPPRKSKSPQAVRKGTIQDRLVIGTKVSSEVAAINKQVKSVELTDSSTSHQQPQAVDDLLINLDTPMDAGGDKNFFAETVESLSAFDVKSLNSAGDYVKLRETPIRQNTNNRRSISRTPAMKLPANITPKRPSIRRERSPISPDEEERGMSAFDPLWGDKSPVMQLQRTEEKGSLSSVITTSPPNSSSDSLLKTWEIGHLTPGVNVSPSNFDYSKPTSNSPSIPGQNFVQKTAAFFSPQPYSVQTNFMNSPLNAGSITSSREHPPPQIPPRPKNRPYSSVFTSPGVSSSDILQPSSMGQDKTPEKSDPFGDLVNLNKERTSPQPKKSSWETFD